MRYNTKGSAGHAQNEKQGFLVEITKADHRVSEAFYFIKIYGLAELNLFIFCMMFFIKKGSFPAKTADR